EDDHPRQDRAEPPRDAPPDRDPGAARHPRPPCGGEDARGSRRHPPVSAPDVLVVGSGVAGLAAALRLAPRSVRLLTASPTLDSGSSPLAQGGIADAVGEGGAAARDGTG